MAESKTSVPAVRGAADADDPKQDWAEEFADKIVDTIGKVREMSTGKALKVARYAVYGLFIAIVGIALLILFLILAVRGLVILTDVIFTGEEVWLAHTVLGALLSLLGAVLWSKRPPLPDH